VPDIRLVPVRPEQADAVLGGDLGGHSAAPGWPHADTPHALAFLEVGGRCWLVVDGDGLVVGELGTKGPPDPAGRVEIGYGLAAASRGRGLGTAAVSALLAELAADAAVSEVVAHVALDNTASRRLLARLGFIAAGDVEAGEVRYHRPTR
jgi:RimJ/RimL family protein N-acetyltransferase